MKQVNLIILILAFIFPSLGFAQQVQLDGKIIDGETKEPLLFAQVALFRVDEEKSVAFTQTDEKGTFILKAPKGNYDLRFYLVGYQNKLIPNISLDNNKNLGNVTLTSENQDLEAVVVQSQSIPMRTDVEGIVINPSNNLSNMGGTLLDILRNTPSVTVSDDGSISLRGSSGTNILINGRNSSLTQNLDQLPASAIDQIKIINNPNARYDAEAEGGVINIILKRGDDLGTHGGVELTYGTRNRLNTGARINHRSSAFNIYGGYNFRNWKRIGQSETRREIFADEETLFQEGDYRETSNDHNFNFGGDYFFGKNIISYEGVFNTGHEVENNQVYSRLEDNNTQDIELEYVRGNIESEDDKGIDNALIYERTFEDKDRKFRVNLSNSYRNQYQTQEIDIYRNASEALPENLNGQQKASTDEKRYTTVIQADYIHPFNENSKFESGLKTTLRKFDNDYKFYQLENGAFQEDSDVSNHFLYEDQIYAAYFIYSRSSEKFDISVGTRAEQTIVNSLLYNTNEENNQKYLNLFPSLQALYKLDKKNSIKFTYSRRIDRPTAWRLNPFPDITDSLNVRRGNPNLQPELIHSMELGHMVNFEKSSLTTNIFYRHVDGQLDYIAMIEDGITYRQPDNLNTAQAFGLELIGLADLTEWWSINGSVSLFQIKVDGSNLGEEFVNNGFSWNSKLTSDFKLPYDISLQWVGNYESPEIEAQGRDLARYNVDASLKRGFFDKKGMLSLSLRDVFNTRQFAGYNESSTFSQEFVYKRESRILLLSARYNF
ncbi:TonB-dependent receptor [Echinicola jeungdonensis]|uniref:TonB-dependent receptor domain-containing protein n=1 Tax=Echinicola jeungdonensis TaxID=709343 RepID=A0ABV5J2G0_9BACT|nr:TonB-dependent receptor [Echinicola jeungdonensis]MDN3668022.1 TonB-dependent receptor [Echinicola jeungdonensis]